MSGYPVVEQGIPGVGVSDEIAGLTTTPVTRPFVSGLLALDIEYRNMGSAAGTLLYAVFNALDNADAVTKLATSGARKVIPLGSTKSFPFLSETPCYRVDLASNVGTETGTTLTILDGKVQA